MTSVETVALVLRVVVGVTMVSRVIPVFVLSRSETEHDGDAGPLSGGLCG